MLKNPTVHSQNNLQVDALYNIKRKKNKTVRPELAFASHLRQNGHDLFFYRTCNVFFICYAVILLQYSKSSRTHSSVYKINSVFKQFYFFTKDFDNVKLIFIELPIYSIYW